MRNSYLVILSCLVSIAIIYVILFIHTFFNLHHEFAYNFKSLENLNFHKKYSKKIHHLRDEPQLNALWKKAKVEDLLFTTINKLEDKEMIVLFQGDSWMEMINYASLKIVKNFKSKKRFLFHATNVFLARLQDSNL